MHMRRHGDSVRHLYLALESRGEAQDQRTLMKWCTGQLLPRTAHSLVVLNNIERRYKLPMGYFRAKLPHQARGIGGVTLSGIPESERRRLAWHLPDDFLTRSKTEQEEILNWVRTVIISGSTDYRRFQAAAMRQRYAVRFPAFLGSSRRPALPHDEDGASDLDLELESAVTDAPEALDAEMQDLLRFKTATLTAFGFQRNGVWNNETASQKVEHLGLMFGALASDPRSKVKGAGVPPDSICFAMLIFPAVWDWYLQWREARRGFYTKWEVDMLSVVLSMARAETGWIRQNPDLANRLRPIPGMITQREIDRVRDDWDGSCDAFYKHARHRVREIQRVARIHRDPFEPILPVLEADSPVGEYRKITEEIMRLMPDEARYPRAAAEAVRSFLLIRLGMHTGLRQRNLRELLVCPRGRTPTSERHLEDKKRGEMRWSDRDGGWEVLIPSIAFKNSTSSFFGSKPFRLVLPDLAGLYDAIEAYIDRHRGILIGEAKDPGTFFVKSVKRTSADAAYNQNTFYEAWRLTIQRYGIFNPYTGRGAIKGLLPHGPHNVRDVLATHILKQTGSYEQASYAIQDTPAMVQQHYGRFLPQDKAAIAAKILNRVWEEV
jgi:integrase